MGNNIHLLDVKYKKLSSITVHMGGKTYEQ